MRRRALVLGLDCVPPALLFERYAERLPNLSSIVRAGASGPLRSIVPPITVPAWASMTTGADPGVLGMYGFRDRDETSYGYKTATSERVSARSIFDEMDAAKRKHVSMFVPPGFPPKRRENGLSFGCFLTPTDKNAWCSHAGWKETLTTNHGPYAMDVHGFRSGEKKRIEDELFAMTKQHFSYARKVWREFDPDLFWLVEIGPDRLHHAFWNDLMAHDESVGSRYYELLDGLIGEWLQTVGDDTSVFVVSDHGAKSLRGAFAINEWLIREGWLVLKAAISPPRPVRPDDIDWKKTRMWGEGGYVARLYANVRGREPEGIVDANEVHELVANVAKKLEHVRLDDGSTLVNVVFDPKTTYAHRNGRAPELIVACGDLDYRAVGSVGSGTLVQAGNDLGEDGCNHDWNGVFAMRPSKHVRAERAERLLDVKAVIARSLGLEERE